MTITSPATTLDPLSRLRQRFRQLFRSESFVIAILLIIVIAVFFRDVVFSNHTFLMENVMLGTMPYPDFGPYHYTGARNIPVWDPEALSFGIEPWDRYITQTYQSGQIPFWDPYQGLGVPLQSNGGTGMFDPLKALIYLAPIQDWPVAVDVHVLVRFFLAAFFTYLFMRALNVGMTGALFAAITYMLATYLVHFANLSFFRLDTLLPLVIYAYHRLATRRTFGASVVVILSIFLLIVGDFPEVLPLHLGLGLGWYLFQRVLQDWQTNRKLPIVSILALAASTTIAGFLLGAFTLLPFVQLFQAAYHVHDPGVLATMMQTNYPFYQAGGFLVASQFNVGKLTLFSVVLVVFAVLVGIRTRLSDDKLRTLRRYSLFFTAVALAIILVTYRVPVFGWIADLPILNIIFLTRSTQPDIVFCIAAASGIGLELLLSKKVKSRARWIVIASIVVFALSLLATVGLNMGMTPNPGATNWLIIAAILLILFNLFARLAVIGKTGIRLAGILIVAFAVIEPAIYLRIDRPIRYDPYTPPPFVSYLQGLAQPFRIIGLDTIMVPTLASAYRLEDIRFNDAVTPKKFYDFEQRFLAPTDHPIWATLTRFDGYSTPPIFGHWMDMLNVGYIMSTKPTPPRSAYGDGNQFEQVYAGEGIYIYRNKNAYPRAFIVHKAEIIAGEQGVFDRIVASDYDPSRAVILDEALPSAFAQSLPADSSPYEQADVTSKSVNSTIIHAELKQPGILILSELAYPGWQAFVDDEPTKMYNAYGFMRAVALDAGSHLVEFRYYPTMFFIGAGISLLTLAILIAIGAFRWQHSRQHIHEDGTAL